MKKELKINRNDYILLEVLYMLDYLSFDNIIEKELINFRKLVEKQTFGNFFKNNGDILNEECILRYTFDKQ